MQETRVQSLIREESTCRRATKRMCHNYWACALEPRNRNSGAHWLQLQQPACPRAHAPQHVGSSQIRDCTRVSCIGRQILYHWATREAQEVCLILEVCFTGSGTCTFSGAYLVRPANHVIKIFGVAFPKQYPLVNKLVTCFLKINSLEKSHIVFSSSIFVVMWCICK